MQFFFQDEINISTDTLFLKKEQKTDQLYNSRHSPTQWIDMRKKAGGEEERSVAHFSDETLELCIHTVSSCSATQMYKYLFVLCSLVPWC